MRHRQRKGQTVCWMDLMTALFPATESAWQGWMHMIE